MYTRGDYETIAQKGIREGDEMRLRRRLVALIGAGVVVAAVLAFAAIVRAGNGAWTFNVVAAPTTINAGQTGFVGAKFTPTGGGAATHVAIKLTMPAQAASITLASCPGGTYSLTGTVAECDIASVQNGQTVKFFVTYTATGTGTGAIQGDLSFDNGNGSNGQSNTDRKFASFTVYPPGDASHAGACTQQGGTLPTLVEPTTGKGADKDTYNTATSSLGLPCTAAQVSIDPTIKPGNANSFGLWSVISAPSGALSHVFLTLNTIPNKVNWKNAVLLEVFGDTAPFATDPVPLCSVSNTGVLTVPAPVSGGRQHFECLDPSKPQSPFGSGGVEWSVWYVGNGADPSSGY